MPSSVCANPLQKESVPPLVVESVRKNPSQRGKRPKDTLDEARTIATSTLALRLRVREPHKTIRIIHMQPIEGWRLPSSVSLPWLLRCNKKCTTYKTLKVVPTSGTSTKGTLTLQLQEVRADKSEVPLQDMIINLPEGTLQPATQTQQESVSVPQIPTPRTIEPTTQLSSQESPPSVQQIALSPSGDKQRNQNLLSIREKRLQEFGYFMHIFVEAQTGIQWSRFLDTEGNNSSLLAANSALREDVFGGTALIGLGLRISIPLTSHHALTVFHVGARLQYGGPSPSILAGLAQVGVFEYCYFSNPMSRSFCASPKLYVGFNKILSDPKSLGIVGDNPPGGGSVSLQLRVQLMQRLYFVIEPTWTLLAYKSSEPENRTELTIRRFGFTVPIGLQFVPKFWSY